jgi:hypothetical protein
MTSKRREFQPGECQPLEDRALLSWYGPVGTLGDSYTDEYRFYPPDRVHARNWVEILHATREVRFGHFTTRSLGAPRNQGFADNWAQSNATSNDMIANQLPGLSAQVASGQIKTAWIFIGGNDFTQYLEGLQSGQIPANDAASALVSVETQLETNVNQAVTTLLSASAKVNLVLVTLPDVTLQPYVQQLANNPADQPILNATSQAIDQYNTFLKGLAAGNPRIALIDLAAQAGQISAAAAQNNGMVPFGGTTINLTTPGNDYHNFFLADGIHVGTVAQGIIADDFITAVDTNFGAHIPLLTPTQIVAFAKRVQSPHGANIP